MFPPRFERFLFALILSGIMSFLVSGVASFRAAGLVDGFFFIWMGAWAFSWCVACPTAFFVAPFTRRVVQKLVRHS